MVLYFLTKKKTKSNEYTRYVLYAYTSAISVNGHDGHNTYTVYRLWRCIGPTIDNWIIAFFFFFFQFGSSRPPIHVIIKILQTTGHYTGARVTLARNYANARYTRSARLSQSNDIIVKIHITIFIVFGRPPFKTGTFPGTAVQFKETAAGGCPRAIETWRRPLAISHLPAYTRNIVYLPFP